MKDNSPIIGPMDWEKERRWQREREASFARFKQAVAYLLPMTQDKRLRELERYQSLHGVHARKTLEACVIARLLPRA